MKKDKGIRKTIPCKKKFYFYLPNKSLDGSTPAKSLVPSGVSLKKDSEFLL
jgi:hypothetical protein